MRRIEVTNLFPITMGLHQTRWNPCVVRGRKRERRL